MILKVRGNEEESWIYYECDNFYTRRSCLKDVKNPEGAELLFDEKSNVVKIIRICLREKNIKNIITDRVCYILNNEGKTIDTI